MLGLTLQLGLASRARRLPQRLPAANISVGKPGLLLGGGAQTGPSAWTPGSAVKSPFCTIARVVSSKAKSILVLFCILFSG